MEKELFLTIQVVLVGYCLGIGGSIAAGIMLGRRDRAYGNNLYVLFFAFLKKVIKKLLHFVTGRPGKSVRSIQTGSIKMGKCRRDSGFAKDSSDVRTFWCQHGLSVKRRVR